jgi:hypothetical protein
MTTDDHAATHTYDDDETGGDAACWLGRVCPECGAMIEGPMGLPCWRCGTTPQEQETNHG